jgi:GYF domain 2/Domain of unknown function (DUF4234)
MQYQVSREGQLYGPYTLEDLQRYVTSGNVLLTDLAKSEDMPDWIPVAQILGTTAAPVPAYAPSAYPPAPAPTGIPYPDPPNLHWLLVLILSFFTCGIFTIVWNILLCLWVRRVQPASNALSLYISAYAIVLLGTALSFVNNFPVFIASMHHEPPPHQNIPLVFVAGCISLTGWIVRLVARFTLRGAIQLHYNVAEPMHLYLGPIMTFFFGSLYFTYHINRLMEIKQSMRYRNPAAGI